MSDRKEIFRAVRHDGDLVVEERSPGTVKIRSEDPEGVRLGRAEILELVVALAGVVGRSQS